ncbi:MAG: hypothetical protein AAGF02_07965, partial [Actinomycetota bacterium]
RVTVMSTRLFGEQQNRQNWVHHTTIGREVDGRITGLVTVFDPGANEMRIDDNGSWIDVQLADGSAQLFVPPPLPVDFTMLFALIDDRQVGISAALSLDELRDVLRWVAVDAEGRARLVPGSPFVTVSRSSTAGELIHHEGTIAELDTPDGAVQLQTFESNADPLGLLAGKADEARLVAVRGAPAWYVSGTSEYTLAPGIAWQETDRQTAALTGDVPLATLLRVAHELEIVDQATWLAAADG